MSFGLPYPSGGYPLNTFNGGYPAQNPYFGSISPNGLSLGLVNVNPLVSFQFAKNEFGEKTFKPLVNLHVTPNENLINKVGNLFKAKKIGGYGGNSQAYNQHYHTHTHYDASSPHHYESHHPPHYPYVESGPSHFDGPIHYANGPVHYANAPHYGAPGYYPSSPGGGYAGDYGFSSPAFYRDTSYHSNANNIESSLTASAAEFEPSTYYGRSANGSAVDRIYADNFANFKQPNAQPNAQQNAQQNIVAQAAVHGNQNQGTRSVSFPSNRRKRNVNRGSDIEVTPIDEIDPKSKILEKVIFM